MVEYNCPRCGKIYYNKNKFRLHINRVRKCEINPEYSTEILLPNYTISTDIVPDDIIPITKYIESSEKTIKLLVSKINKLEQDVEVLKRENILLNKVVFKKKRRTNPLVPHGDDKQYTIISDDRYIKILNCRKDAVLRMIEFIHKNEAYPEYRNLYFKNDIGFIYDVDNQWEQEDQYELLVVIVPQYIEQLVDALDRLSDDVRDADELREILLEQANMNFEDLPREKRLFFNKIIRSLTK